MKYLVIIVLILAGFSSCCKRVYPVSESIQDSLFVHDTVLVRDTAIPVPGAHVSFTLFPDSLINQLPAGIIAKRKQNQAVLTIIKQPSGQITANCDCDSFAIYAELYDKLHTEAHTISTTKTLVQELKVIPWWAKILAWAGGISLAGVGLIAFLKIKKIL